MSAPQQTSRNVLKRRPEASRKRPQVLALFLRYALPTPFQVELSLEFPEDTMANATRAHILASMAPLDFRGSLLPAPSAPLRGTFDGEECAVYFEAGGPSVHPAPAPYAIVTVLGTSTETERYEGRRNSV